MSEAIPFDRLGIPAAMRGRLGPEAPVSARLAIARGLLPATVDAQIAMCYALATSDPVAEVAEAARRSLLDMPIKQVLPAVSERTHPKVLEFFAEFRPDEHALDERLLRLRATNDRAARLIARRADADLCEQLVTNHERLVMTPAVLIDLHGNPACRDSWIEKAQSFLELEGVAPALPAERGVATETGDDDGLIDDEDDELIDDLDSLDEGLLDGPTRRPSARPAACALPAMDIEAEVEAAIRGGLSPALQAALSDQGARLAVAGAFADMDVEAGEVGDFVFDFADEDDFDQILLRELAEGEDGEERRSLVQIIQNMNITQKIKLAYLGNKEARAILIRDRVKTVSVAVVRSGRMTDQEVTSFAADRNLPREVIREICLNKEFLRKYPVKVALINNPKAPIQTTMGLLRDLNKKDLAAIARSRNVSAVLKRQAYKMSREKK